MVRQSELVFASSQAVSPLGVWSLWLQQVLEIRFSAHVPFCHEQQVDRLAMLLQRLESLMYEHAIPLLEMFIE
ncbi:MAG: hypothetical protein AABZ06_14905 [Bdellovibrionota bacterium]